MLIVTIIPKTQRAKNRCKEHGENFEVLEQKDGRILVKSLQKSFRNKDDMEHWMGWFSKLDAIWYYQDTNHQID